MADYYLCENGHDSEVLPSGICKECVKEQNEKYVEDKKQHVEVLRRKENLKNRKLKNQKENIGLKIAKSITNHYYRRAAFHPDGSNHTEIFSQEDILKLLETQNHECIGCFASFEDVPYEIDHKVALSFGGRNTPDNIQLLCKTCNVIKRDRHNEDWLSETRYRQVIEYLEYLSEVNDEVDV